MLSFLFLPVMNETESIQLNAPETTLLIDLFTVFLPLLLYINIAFSCTQFNNGELTSME